MGEEVRRVLQPNSLFKFNLHFIIYNIYSRNTKNTKPFLVRLGRKVKIHGYHRIIENNEDGRSFDLCAQGCRSKLIEIMEGSTTFIFLSTKNFYFIKAFRKTILNYIIY